jgi:LDH2 family malate/lactate/ureidoglycolate dehydrogenase
MNPEDLAVLGEPRDHRDMDALLRFSTECLERKGYSPAFADATAFALVEADARGIFSHGAAGGTGLEEALARVGVTATVDIEAEPRRLPQKYASIGVIDADGAPGHYSSRLAVEWVRELAAAHGIAKVYVSNGNHFGAAGVWSEEISRDGRFEAHVTCTTGSCVRLLGDDPEGIDYTRGAAVGGTHRLGTNPDAWSIPYAGGLFTIDMANTELAASLCVKYFKEGRASGATRSLKIPNYVADENYRPTLDPERVMGLRNGLLFLPGSIFPAGGLRGYKGQISLQRIEADHSYAGGPIRAVDVSSKTEQRRISHSFEAQVVDFLYTADEARARMADLVADWARCGGPSTRLPGERSRLAREYSVAHGIPYSADQIRTLARCGAMVGMELDRVPGSVNPYPRALFTK